jgi:hypothetical protein
MEINTSQSVPVNEVRKGPTRMASPTPRGRRIPRNRSQIVISNQPLDDTNIPINISNADIVKTEAVALDTKVITENPQLGESVVDTVDSVMNKLNAAGFDGLNPLSANPTEQSLKNAELAINVTSLAFAVGLGITGFGVPFIPVVFAMGMGLKSLLNHVNTQDDILLIYNILHMYFMLVTYPTIRSVMQRIDCKSQKKEDCPKVTFVKSNFKDPRAEEKVIEFIEDGLAKYIEVVTLLVKKSEVQVSEKILDCHNICTGLFTSLTKYLELNNEEPNLDMIAANVMFTPNNATEATTAVNIINDNVQKKISITGKVLMDRGYAIFSSITRAGAAVGIGGTRKYKKNQKKPKKTKTKRKPKKY